MSNFPHYFVAIPLEQQLKDYFSTWQDDLQEKVFYKIWPHKLDLHITLKFLGAVGTNQLKNLQKGLHTVEQLSSFEIKVGGIGTFGNPKSPRVLWAGVEKTNALQTLQETVENCSTHAGFSKENREYNPHITLAKKYDGEAAYETIAAIKNEYTAEQTMQVNEIVIYQIFPSRNPKYEIVQSYNLKS